jgi:hypothetical protein
LYHIKYFSTNCTSLSLLAWCHTYAYVRPWVDAPLSSIWTYYWVQGVLKLFGETNPYSTLTMLTPQVSHTITTLTSWVAHESDYVDISVVTIHDYFDVICGISNDGILGGSPHPRVVASTTQLLTFCTVLATYYLYCCRVKHT